MLWHQPEGGWNSSFTWGCPKGHWGREPLGGQSFEQSMSLSICMEREWPEERMYTASCVTHSVLAYGWGSERSNTGWWESGRFGEELYALASPNEQSVRILVFLEAAHQRLLAARRALKNQMNRCTSMYKGGSADCHLLVCNTTLGLQYGTQRGLAGTMWKVECFRFFLSCGRQWFVLIGVDS